MLFIEVRGTTGKSGPARGLEIDCKLRWAAPTALLREGIITLKEGRDQNLQLAEPVRIPLLPKMVKKDSEEHESFRFILTLEAIRHLEERRRGNDMHLRLSVRSGAATVEDGNAARPIGVAVFASYTQEFKDFDWTIPQSEWVKRLAEMQYDEIELFELSKLPLEEEKSLTEALSRLRQARAALRQGDYRAVLANCRAAFESASKHQHAGDVRQGFDALIDRAFPKDEGRRALINGYIKSISEYMHKYGRHEDAPPVHASRSEAEWILTSTLGVFSMFSRRIAGREL